MRHLPAEICAGAGHVNDKASTKSVSGAVTVYLGSETGDLAGGHLSVVIAPYTENGQPAGAVGVLGPTRMDYARVMPLVDAAAAAMSDVVSRASRRS